MSHSLRILDSSNIVESYPGITLPLTASFIEDAYYGVFKGALLRLLGDPAAVQADDAVLRHMVETWHGRAFYRIDNWYRIIGYFPLSKKIIRIWQDMLGVEERVVTGTRRLGFARKLRVLKNVVSNLRKVPREMAELEQDFELLVEGMSHASLGALDNRALVALYERHASQILPRWDITLANDMYTFVFTALAQKLAPTTWKQLLGKAQIASILPLEGLIELSRLAILDDKLDHLLSLTSDDDSAHNGFGGKGGGGDAGEGSREAKVAAFVASDEPLAQALAAYIDRYGDRYLEELKLEAPTYRTSPWLLVQTVLEYAGKLDELEASLTPPAMPTSKPPKPNPLARPFVTRALRGIHHRETSRLNRSRLYGIVRGIFLALAANLVAEGSLDTTNDIFYLHIDEVFAQVESGNLNLRTLVAQRKQEYAVYRQEDVPARLILDGNRPVAKDNDTAEDVRCADAASTAEGSASHILTGTPVSPGIVTGEVLVITDIHRAGNTQGKIIVARSTDPGWVFLLAGARGIITERGSLLSHTAIVSREMGIPSIVGVPQATTLLHTGDLIHMDATTGTIGVVVKS